MTERIKPDVAIYLISNMLLFSLIPNSNKKGNTFLNDPTTKNCRFV